MTRDPIEALDAAFAAWPPGPIAIALSGGLDSSALVHALASRDAARARGLRAIHVDHGLHAESARWAEAACRFAAALDVPCDVVRIEVPRDSGRGLEGAARAARYAAFDAALGTDEILVTAHHADDQAETVLLRLLRGAGVSGFAAMSPFGPLPHVSASGGSAHRVARPWLEVTRDAIRAYAGQHALAWIEDPSNDALVHDRNFLRAEIMPRLRERWPHAGRTLARSAALARGAADVVDERVRRELAHAQGDDASTIRIDALRVLEPFLRLEVIRAWIAGLGLPAPSASVLESLATLLDARGDATPIVRWRGAEIRRYRGLAFAMAPLVPVDATWSAEWRGASLQLPSGLGTLVREHSDSAGAERHWIPAFAGMTPSSRGTPGTEGSAGSEGSASSEGSAGSGATTGSDATPTKSGVASFPELRVGFRRGGERIAVAASRPTREVRLVLQELGIPPWERERIPLVYDAQGLVAIGDLVVAERFPGRLRWERGSG